MKMYVLYVRGGHENDVLRLLKEKSIIAYSPSYTRMIRTKSGFREDIRIMFPNYVFILCDMDADIYYKIKNTHYAVKFIMPGNPIALYEDETERILKISDGGKPFKVLKSEAEAEKMGFEVIKCDRRQGILTASFLLYGQKKRINLGIERDKAH